MSGMTWRQCLEAGRTAKEAAEARGTHITAAYGWAKRNHTAFRPAPKGTLRRKPIDHGRESPSHVPCPQCGGRAVTVIDSRPTSAPGFATIRRRRGCRDCDHRWMSYEVPERVLQAMSRPTPATIRDALLRIVAAMPE